MSLLNQLFNRGLLGAKCKTCLTLVISRIKLLQNKRGVNLKLMRKEIAQFLQTGQEAIARIRVEHVIHEENIWAGYEILELFCEFVLARFPVLESQKECPPELREAVASIIFAAPRCSDLPDLLQVKNSFAAKYGKEFVLAASELRPDTSVNRAVNKPCILDEFLICLLLQYMLHTALVSWNPYNLLLLVLQLIEKLAIGAPPADAKLKLLKEIAQEFGLDWDSSATEIEFRKTHDDLLDGSKQISLARANSQAPDGETALEASPSNGSHPVMHPNGKQAIQPLESSRPASNAPISNQSENGASMKKHVDSPTYDGEEIRPRPSEVLEIAKAAIAFAERATATAHAAAALANVKFGSLNLEEAKSSSVC